MILSMLMVLMVLLRSWCLRCWRRYGGRHGCDGATAGG